MITFEITKIHFSYYFFLRTKIDIAQYMNLCRKIKIQKLK